MRRTGQPVSCAHLETSPRRNLQPDGVPAMPIPLPDYDHLDATALADLIRIGEATPGDLADAALARIAVRDPSLHAFPYIVEAAPALREHAERAPAGPFQGVPFAVKDLIHPVAGMPMRSGSRRTRALCRRRRHAGDALPRGRAGPRRENGDAGVRADGRHRARRLPPDAQPVGNGPLARRLLWRRRRRRRRAHPALRRRLGRRRVHSHSGQLLRPVWPQALARARERGAAHGETRHGASASLAVTRSVRDAAALLDAVAGPAPGEPAALPKPESPFLDEVGRDPGPLRIGFSTASPLGTPVVRRPWRRSSRRRRCWKGSATAWTRPRRKWTAARSRRATSRCTSGKSRRRSERPSA